MLNALLGRDVSEPIALPETMPTARLIDADDDRILALAAEQNPELKVLAEEIHGKTEGIQLARLQYLPDFSLSASTDLGGVAQNLVGMVTVPFLRHEAIDAAIAQAEANLRAAEAMQSQTRNDLRAQIIGDVATLRDADRQLASSSRPSFPRARQVVTIARAAYESGQSTLLDLSTASAAPSTPPWAFWALIRASKPLPAFSNVEPATPAFEKM